MDGCYQGDCQSVMLNSTNLIYECNLKFLSLPEKSKSQQVIKYQQHYGTYKYQHMGEGAYTQGRGGQLQAR